MERRNAEHDATYTIRFDCTLTGEQIVMESLDPSIIVFENFIREHLHTGNLKPEDVTRYMNKLNDIRHMNTIYSETFIGETFYSYELNQPKVNINSNSI